MWAAFGFGDCEKPTGLLADLVVAGLKLGLGFYIVE